MFDVDFQARTYFETRFSWNPARDRVWEHISRYLESFWNLSSDAQVLELGTGYGSWIRSIHAKAKHALDLHPDLPSLLNKAGISDVVPHVGSCVDLSRYATASMDLVVASNLLEHLVLEDVFRCVDEVKRVLKAGGVFCVVQPNFSIATRHYFDDFTHRTIFTDVSLSDLFLSRGLEMQKCWRRFLPLSMGKSTGALTFLVPFYLRSPIKPLAGQMCLIARKSRSSNV